MAETEAARLFDEGNLEGAIDAATAAVRARPTDTGARGFLCELLCFRGDLERADKQLDLLGDQDPALSPGIALFRQILRGETARREVFEEGRPPEFLDEPPEHVRLSLKALAAARAGGTAEATELAGAAEAARPAVAGTRDGTPFSDWRDVDDITAGVLEIVTSTGKYYWLALERLRSLAFEPPKRTRDLIWRQAAIDVREGPEAVVYIPAVYAGTRAAADAGLTLGRATRWTEPAAGPVRGLGLRTWLFDDADLTIMEPASLTVAAPGDGAP